MKPIECDVYSKRDLILSCLKNPHCNFYVKGNLDTIYACTPLEIFGDVVVDGVVSGCYITIHGNLICNTLRCDNIIVEKNIYISEYANVNEDMKSVRGNISIHGPADISNLIACEGSVYIKNNLVNNCLKAFDSIYVGGDLLGAETIIAGSGITVKGNIDFDILGHYNQEYANIQVLTGGIHSKNINID